MSDPVLPYTTILLDEAQDTSELMIDLLRKQTQAQLIVVGDDFQSIYGWRGATSAMDAFSTTNSAQLSQSFRFGSAIAEMANAVLRNHLDSDARLSGLASIRSNVREIDSPRLVLARTNSTLIGSLISAIRQRNGHYGVVGGVDDLVRLAQGAEALINGRRTHVADLAEFAHWSEVKEASKEEFYRHLRALVTLVDDYGTAFLIRTLESVRGHERDEARCTQIFSTAHKAKGREFPTVVLEDDFVAPPKTDDVEDANGWTPEEANLLYVAATRAQFDLDPTRCTALADAWGDGEWPTAP